MSRRWAFLALLWKGVNNGRGRDTVLGQFGKRWLHLLLGIFRVSQANLVVLHNETRGGTVSGQPISSNHPNLSFTSTALFKED